MRPETGMQTTQGPVARIRDAGGAICGTGFLIGERHVMTCAHIIDDAVQGRDRGEAEAPKEPITLDLPFLDRRGLATRVVAWRPMPLGNIEDTPVSDIAVLELDALAAGGVDSREAVLSAPASGTAFTTCGFPRGMDSGAEAGGELRMSDAGGWRHIQDVQDHGFFVERGFSGAPVFDAEAARHGTRRLLGMVVAADRDPARRLAFVIPTPTLCQVWPLLAKPYKELFSFTENDADLFFGRDLFIEELYAKIEEHPVLTVIGPSGAGKSSVVMAGLVPRLFAGGGWVVARCRPGRRPLYRFAYALEELAAAASDKAGSINRRAAALEAQLHADPERIVDHTETLLERLPGAKRLLLVVDQFEELFTHGDAERVGENAADEASARQLGFGAVLAAIGRQKRDAALRAVLTLRADFTGRALQDRVLADLMRDADAKLGPMTPAELADAIECPAKRFGVAFESGLVPQIVSSVSGAAGSLPLLQFALDRLWRRQQDGKLTRSVYAAIGGVEGALAEHAEAVFARLGAEEQPAARRVLTRLVRLAAPGEQAEDTRAVVTREEIGEPDWAVVQDLSDERLVMTGRDPATGTETAELVHEALISFTRAQREADVLTAAPGMRSWDRLRSWLDEDREFGLWRQRLRNDVGRWKGNNDDALLRGNLLAEADGWRSQRSDDLNDTEVAFIDAGLEQERREHAKERERERREVEKERRQREERLRILEDRASQQKQFLRWLGAFATALVLALLGAGYFSWNATAAQADAEAASTEALARQLAAEARLTQNEIPGAEAAERAAAMAIESWKRHRTSQAYQVAARSFRELPIARITHDRRVTTLAFNPEGTRLASAGDDGTARMLDVETGKEIARIRYGDRLFELAFSPDGTQLATGGADATARILDLETGQEVARVEHGGLVETLVYSPDGTRLASSSLDNTARILDVKTGKEVVRIDGIAVAALAFSPDGTRLATGDHYGTALVLDAETGDEIARSEHVSDVQRFAFSPDGTRLAVGSRDGTVRVLDVETNSEIARFEHGDELSTIAFSSDGIRLATGSNDGTVYLLNPKTGEQIARIEHGEERVLTLAFSPEGARLATGSSDGAVRILDAGTGDEIARIEHDSFGADLLAFSPDGARLATASNDKDVRILDARTGDEIARLRHNAPTSTLAFSPDSARLATGSSDGTVSVFEVGGGGGEVAQIKHGDWISTLAFSPDGTRLATGSGDGTARILNAETGNEIARIEHEGRVETVAFSPDSTRLATGGEDGTARIFNAETGSEIVRVKHEGPVTTVAFDSDDARLATGSEDGSARILEAETGNEIARIVHGAAVQHVEFSADSARLATGSNDGIVRILEAETGKEIARVEHEDQVTALAYSPVGTSLAIGTGGGNGTVYILHPETGDQIARIEHGEWVRTLAYSRNGAHIATSSGDGTVRILDAETGNEIARIEHGGQVDTVAFSPDGAWIATGSEDGIARVSDFVTGEEIARFEHDDWVLVLAFSSDGSRLATGSADGTASIVVAEPGGIMQRLCTARAGRNLTRDEWRRYIGKDEPWRKSCPEWRTVEEISAAELSDLPSL